MKNRNRFFRKIRIIRRLSIALAGFFVLLLFSDARNPVILDKGCKAFENAAARRIAGRTAEADEGTEKEEPVTAESTVSGQSVPVLTETFDSSGRQRCYTVKINELVFSLSDRDEVIAILTAAKSRYDLNDEYEVVLVKDNERRIPAMTACLRPREDSGYLFGMNVFEAGVARDLTNAANAAGTNSSRGIEAFDEAIRRLNSEDAEGEPRVDLGIQGLEFADKVEIAEAYMFPQELTPLDEAIAIITEDKQKEQIYEVQPGDTLSQICERLEMPMEELIAVNDALENENSTLRAGQELVITVPEPELSFFHTEEMYYEENFNAPIEYVDNDDWYTTDEKTLQDPIAGFHKVVADVTFRNDQEQAREVLREVVVMDATPKIVEKGTKIPPIYYKPISGGRLSSGFGKRSAPKKGASTYHKGIDWAIPVGSAVVASSAGTITRAGWGSGYGNVVYISHPDGRETRYGHLSKVLVKVGQKVSGGEKIALSGNTGRSTGPHIHFEILVNGAPVNPLKYLN